MIRIILDRPFFNRIFWSVDSAAGLDDHGDVGIV